MAAVSEVKSTKIIQSYVSSNSYYGYVPPINQTTIKQNNYQQIDNLNQQHHQHQQQQNNGNDTTLAMETDDVDNLNGDNLHCQNNHYVIPEMVKSLDDLDGLDGLDGLDNNLINTRSYCGRDPGSRQAGEGDSVGLIYRVTHSDADADAEAETGHNNNNNNNNTTNNNNNYHYYYYNNNSNGNYCYYNNNRNTVTGSTDIQRRNRKRNNYEHDGAEADGFQNHGKKKFRPDGGNKCVCRETRICTRGSGPSAMHNEPATCLVSSSVRCFPIQSQVSQVNQVNQVDQVYQVNHYCNDSYNPSWVQPPGNSSEPYPIQCETRVTRDSTQVNKENLVTRVDNLVDYEMMLMETHGCSAYHLHRHQLLDIDTFDTEF